MPIGVICNCMSVAIGGLAGAVLGNKLSEKLKMNLTLIFGLCAMGMGVCSINLLKYLPVVIFSVVVGTGIGVSLGLEEKINNAIRKLQKPLGSLMKAGDREEEQDAYLSSLITVLVLFCASANGIYGCLDAGMSGDHTILISKSILDFFTAMIFACNLGSLVALISIPQFAIFITVYLLARVIYPLTTPEMILDFKGCGGFLLLATGFRMMKLKQFPLIDMIPALLLVMPVSYAWANWILPLL